MSTSEHSKAKAKAKAKSTVLIVDDHPGNLGFLFDYLEKFGYRVLVALDGEEALSQLELITPDIILLDVMMPGLDGYETCARIKNIDTSRDVPVIFMSARTDPRDRVKGFQVGGVDYVSKPVNKEEVLARVDAHVSLRRLQKELLEQNILLEKRHQELRERNEELDAFSHMVAHDLRNPLNRVLGFSELLLEDAPERMNAGEGFTDQDITDLRKIYEAARRMQSVIDSLLMLARISRDRVDIEPVEMSEIIQCVKHDLDSAITRVNAEVTVQESFPRVLGYGPWLERVWFNYINNGLKYGGEPPRLRIGATPDSPGMIRFWIRDNGPGIAKEDQTLAFKPFTRFDQAGREGHGLGLSIVHRIITRLGGEVGVRNLQEGGCEFSFTLPASS